MQVSSDLNVQKLKKLRMKKYLLLILLAPFVFMSCKHKIKTKQSSGGGTCEILVVCEKEDFTGRIGDTLRDFFVVPQEGLNQAEPMFDLAQVTYGRFQDGDLFQRMRNIILINIKSGTPENFQVKQDLFASPQIVFQFNCPDKASFFKLFGEKKEMMMKGFYAKERDRVNRAFKSLKNYKVTDQLNKTFGFNITVPDTWKMAVLKPDFAWIRYEAKDFGQSILISVYPYKGTDVFQTSGIIAHRNEIGKMYVPGPLKETYMSTEVGQGLYPVSRPVNFNGRYAVETRGLWQVEHDFMGGPFVNYVFLDEQKNQIVMIDGFVYAPGKSKRDLLLQMEAIAYSYQEFKQDTIAK